MLKKVSLVEFPISTGRDLRGSDCRPQMQGKLGKEMILNW
jgi:hypothetical protein